MSPLSTEFVYYGIKLQHKQHYNYTCIKCFYTCSIDIFATATSGTNFRPKSVVPLYSNFRCYGNESSLLDCLYSSSPCTSYWSWHIHTDAAVRCVGDIVSGNYIAIDKA